jgi:RNA polymerase subunit RPABC4/transcription elongation factor Spt4
MTDRSALCRKCLGNIKPGRNRCPICSDIIPEAEWSAHVSVHERAPMDERWSDAKE